MSLQEFNTTVAKHSAASAELKEVQVYLSKRRVEDFIWADRVQDFTSLERLQIDSVLEILTEDKWISPSRSYFCETCDQTMDDSICDLCDAHQLNQIDGFRIQKQIPERVPWYKDIRATTYPTDLHKSVITGIPNFAYTLQKNPPAYLISVRSSIAESQEHDYRNEMERSVSTWCSSSSEVSHTDGRCDIILQNKDVGLNTLLGEFKVWGRNDYKDVVNQLLKYFTSFQNTGFVFMINDNKSSIVDSYRPLILSAKGYVQDSIESNPIINSSIWPHFKSVHELNQSQKVTIYHFIFDTKHGIK